MAGEEEGGELEAIEDKLKTICVVMSRRREGKEESI